MAEKFKNTPSYESTRFAGHFEQNDQITTSTRGTISQKKWSITTKVTTVVPQTKR